MNTQSEIADIINVTGVTKQKENTENVKVSTTKITKTTRNVAIMAPIHQIPTVLNMKIYGNCIILRPRCRSKFGSKYSFATLIYLTQNLHIMVTFSSVTNAGI